MTKANIEIVANLLKDHNCATVEKDGTAVIRIRNFGPDSIEDNSNGLFVLSDIIEILKNTGLYGGRFYTDIEYGYYDSVDGIDFRVYERDTEI